MKYLQALLFLLICGTSFSQLDGAWQGVLIQDNQDGTTTNFAIWVTLKIEGTQLKGSFRSEQGGTPYFKVSTISGEIKEDSIIFQEKEIVQHNTQSGMGWCFLSTRFRSIEAEQKLKGSYSSVTKGCIPGELILVKSNKAFNTGATEIAVSSSLNEIATLLKTEETIVGKQFVLSNVNYQSGKYLIVSSSYTYLNKIVALLKDNPTIKIHLKGHTDSDGDDEKNFILSQKRAKSVSDYIIKKGIKPHRITFEGYGESRSIATNEKIEGKKENRRVELLIISE